MKLVDRLLRRNTSPARVAGFIISNFIGLAIVLGGLQFYLDARSIWQADDSFVSTDYLVINKRVTSEQTLGAAGTGFDEAEIRDLESQPWVRRVGRFTSNDFKAYMSVGGGDRGLSTYMFFESIPDGFVDVPSSRWAWRPGGNDVPIIISKDYLTLYNFGFASSAGLPQMSEGIMSGIPVQLSLRSEDGTRTRTVMAHVAGYSNRLNTILVPQEFLEQANAALGSGVVRAPSRLIVDVSSPGDTAIAPYLEERGWETAGDKSASQASFMLKVVTGIVLGIGIVITLLSFFILLLSVSLIMEKNRDRLHSLLMLGYGLDTVGRPYVVLVTVSSVVAYVLAIGGMFILRGYYLAPLTGLGAVSGNVALTVGIGAVLTALIVIFNVASVRRKVRGSWRV